MAEKGAVVAQGRHDPVRVHREVLGARVLEAHPIDLMVDPDAESAAVEGGGHGAVSWRHLC
jgi:hypothetical protein